MECRACGGSGECQTCGGSGSGKEINPHPSPGYVDEDDGDVTCYECNGTGKCHQCGGSGEEADEDEDVG